MKKLWFALFVLIMTMVACAGPIQTQSPTIVPLLPTQASEPTLDRPTEVATLPTEKPTEIPPTQVPPTEIPATEIPPTELPLVPTVKSPQRFGSSSRVWPAAQKLFSRKISLIRNLIGQKAALSEQHVPL